MRPRYPQTKWGARAQKRLLPGHNYALVLARRAALALEQADGASQPARLEHQQYALKQLRRATRSLEDEIAADA